MRLPLQYSILSLQPAISSYKDMNIKGVLVDMGYYEWRSQDTHPATKTSANGAGGHRVYVHLMQVRVVGVHRACTSQGTLQQILYQFE